MRACVAGLAAALLAFSPPLRAEEDPWAQDDPWAPPADPVRSAPAAAGNPVIGNPVIGIPVLPAPAGLGFSSRDRCDAARRADRRGLSLLAPTWSHPSRERCAYAAGADRWTIDEQPAGMVLSGAMDGVLLGSSAALALAALGVDPAERAEQNWDLQSPEGWGPARSGVQRRDPLPVRTDPDAGARGLSDVLALGAGVGALSAPWGFPARNGRLTNGLVMAEVLALSTATQQLVARTVAEPRPYLFQDVRTWSDEDFAWAARGMSGPQATTSYYSGHVSLVASVSYAWASTWTLDALDQGDERAGLALLLFPAAFMISHLEGQLRVDAMAVDSRDAWMGHLAGGLIGAGVPAAHSLAALHGRQRPAAPGRAPMGPRLLSLRPLVGPGTVGLTGAW